MNDLSQDKWLVQCRQGIIDRIMEKWKEYFPDISSLPQPQVLPNEKFNSHGYSVIQEFNLEFPGRGHIRTIIAKIRRNTFWGTLNQENSSGRALTLGQMEYKEITEAVKFFSNQENELGVIRAFDFLEDYNAILMEKADGHDVGELVKRRDQGLVAYFIKCGKWLREYHRDFHGYSYRPWRQSEFQEKLKGRIIVLEGLGVGTKVLEELYSSINKKTIKFDGVSVPVSILHGDFKPRHAWASRGGIKMLDFGNIHPGDCFEDMAAFLVELKVLGLGKPLVFKGQVDPFENALIGGYFGNEPCPEVLGLYVVDWLFKKWGRRLKRWMSSPLGSIVQRGVELIGAKSAIDRFWIDRWFVNVIKKELQIMDKSA